MTLKKALGIETNSQGGDATSKESKTTAIPPNEKDLNAAPSRTSGGAGAEVKP